MSNFFVALFLLLAVALIMGLVKPSLIVRWGKNRNRKAVLIQYGLATLFALIVIGITAPPDPFKDTALVISLSEPAEMKFETTSSTLDIAGTITIPKATLKINGKKVALEEGSFNYTADLIQGENKFEITATYYGSKKDAKEVIVSRALSEEEKAELERQRIEQEAIAEQQKTEAEAKQKADEEVKRQAEIEASMPTDTQAQVIAKNFVEYHLNYPDNSEFPGMFDDGAFVVRTGSRYKVEHWVKASNAFGVLKKTYYTIILQYNGGDWADPRNWTEVSFDFE